MTSVSLQREHTSLLSRVVKIISPLGQNLEKLAYNLLQKIGVS